MLTQDLMKKRRITYFIFLLFLSIIMSSIYAFTFDHPVCKDAADFDNLGWNLAQGNGYSLSNIKPYAKTMFREPSYPIMLGIVYSIFGHNYNAVKVVQIFIHAMSSVMLFWLAKNIFTEEIAAKASLFFSVFPTLANYPSYILSETLFIFLLIAITLFLFKAIKSKCTILFFYAGILFGITILCKVIMLLFFIPIMGELCLKFKYNLYKYAFVFILGGLLIVAPWIMRNHRTFGTLLIASRSGIHLLARAQELDYDKDEIIATVLYSVSERLGKKAYPDIVGDPAEFFDREVHKIYKKNNELLRQGYTDDQIDRMNRNNALKRLIKRPLTYLMQIPLEFLKMTSFAYIPMLNEPHIVKKLFSFKNGYLILSTARGVSRLIAYLVFVLALIGMWFSRREWRNWFLLGMIIFYINVIYSLFLGHARYAVPLIPFYLIFVSYAVTGLFKNQSAA